MKAKICKECYYCIKVSGKCSKCAKYGCLIGTRKVWLTRKACPSSYMEN